ncbi:VOC family protein [Hasllibacter sp. MH4015]|uniref:VOC family protein n=1 Tax=Hasllibacter sp. MH4015 TaxID=2854029 RepID=UPI001CD6F7A3|nr:VOC family protein [Hasllibacter sp. MH4015]
MRAGAHIMLDGGQGAQAIDHWQRAFPDLSAEADADQPGLWTLTFAGMTFTLFDSPEPHDFAPTPSWSMMVDVDRAQDVEGPTAILAEGGKTLMPLDRYDFADRFAWVEDRFGISWQIRFIAP